MTADDLEVERLDDDPTDAPPQLAARRGARDPSSADGPYPGQGRRLARFAVGALVLAVALVVILVGFGNAYYEVTYRTGAEPDGEDDSPTQRFTLMLSDWERATIDSSGTVLSTDNRDFDDDAPLVGVAMERLRWTGFVGVGLAGLALIAAVLHRFGALIVSGPAPVMAAFGTIFLLAGLVPFVVDIPTYARSQWVPGLLDLVPAFFTSNADGTSVHDMTMRPRLGFWLHAVGALAVPVGAVLVFWDNLSRLRERARALAREAGVD